MFSKNYTLTVDKPYDEAIRIFENNLDDMSKKGYSMSGNTVILNSDHRLKLFTGEFKDGRYVVRPADSSDMFYRYRPKMQIKFYDRGNQTEVEVKSKDFRSLVGFVLIAIIFAVFLATSVLIAVDEGVYKALLLPLPAIFIEAFIIILSTKQLNDGKVSLEHIYKDK